MKWKEYFKTERASFISIQAKNEIQVPKMAIEKAKPHRDLIFSSEISAAIRYLTHETQELSLEAAAHEKGLAESYEPFFSEIVEQFCQYKFLWDLHLQSNCPPYHHRHNQRKASSSCISILSFL